MKFKRINFSNRAYQIETKKIVMELSLILTNVTSFFVLGYSICASKLTKTSQFSMSEAK